MKKNSDCLEAQQKQIEELTESLDQLKNRDSQNSSVPPTEDHLKKPSDFKLAQEKEKALCQSTTTRGLTRNGFGEPDFVEKLELENCPVCGADVELVEAAPQKVQQVAELVEQPVSRA